MLQDLILWTYSKTDVTEAARYNRIYYKQKFQLLALLWNYYLLKDSPIFSGMNMTLKATAIGAARAPETHQMQAMQILALSFDGRALQETNKKLKTIPATHKCIENILSYFMHLYCKYFYVEPNFNILQDYNEKLRLLSKLKLFLHVDCKDALFLIFYKCVFNS